MPGFVLDVQRADHIAIVEADGQLRVVGKGLASSPSHAEKLASGHPKNGWRFWWVERDGSAPPSGSRAGRAFRHRPYHLAAGLRPRAGRAPGKLDDVSLR